MTDKERLNLLTDLRDKAAFASAAHAWGAGTTRSDAAANSAAAVNADDKSIEIMRFYNQYIGYKNRADYLTKEIEKLKEEMKND